MIVRAQYPDLSLTSALPAIDEVIFQQFNRRESQFPKFLNVESSDRAIEQTTGLTGLGLFTSINEGGDVRYDDPQATFNKTYTHTQYGLGFKVSRIALDDDKYGWIRKMSKSLGDSARETTEILAASVLNNGFADTGPDGKVLFATDHPLVKSGGTGTNKLNPVADLSPAMIELALTDIRQTKDHSGIKIKLNPAQLVVPAELAFAAQVIMGTTLKPGSTNNDVNSLRNPLDGRALTPIVWDYLTDPDAWFIFCDKEEHDLRFWWREKFNTIHDTETDSRSMKHSGWMRFSYGYQDWFGVYGSPGA